MTEQKKKKKRLAPWNVRVAIAKDVLRWIETKRFLVKKGYYVVDQEFDEYKDVGPALITKEDVDTNADAKEIMQDRNCRVCALGACFLASLDRYNNVGCSDLVANYGNNYHKGQSLSQFDTMKYLKRFFAPEQLDLIEAAFEMNVCHRVVLERDNIELLKAKKWGDEYFNNPTERLEAIMENIIDNRGTFKP